MGAAFSTALIKLHPPGSQVNTVKRHSGATHWKMNSTQRCCRWKRSSLPCGFPLVDHRSCRRLRDSWTWGTESFRSPWAGTCQPLSMTAQLLDTQNKRYISKVSAARCIMNVTHVSLMLKKKKSQLRKKEIHLNKYTATNSNAILWSKALSMWKWIVTTFCPCINIVYST